MKYIQRVNKLYKKAIENPNTSHKEGNYLAYYNEKYGFFFLRHYNVVIFEINYKKRLYTVDGYSLTDKNAVYTMLVNHNIDREFRTKNFKRYLTDWDNDIYTFIGFGKFGDRLWDLSIKAVDKNE